MTYKKFAEVRRSLRISQHKLARRARLSQGLISNYECGYTELRPEQVASLEEALRLELAQGTKNAESLVRGLGSRSAVA